MLIMQYRYIDIHAILNLPQHIRMILAPPEFSFRIFWVAFHSFCEELALRLGLWSLRAHLQKIRSWISDIELWEAPKTQEQENEGDTKRQRGFAVDIAVFSEVEFCYILPYWSFYSNHVSFSSASFCRALDFVILLSPLPFCFPSHFPCPCSSCSYGNHYFVFILFAP
jgi:hypothetical protein